jgi:hypothetical protein
MEQTPMSDLNLFTPHAFDPSTLYGGGAAGYIDYPTLAESSTANQALADRAWFLFVHQSQSIFLIKS